MDTELTEKHQLIALSLLNEVGTRSRYIKLGFSPEAISKAVHQRILQCSHSQVLSPGLPRFRKRILEDIETGDNVYRVVDGKLTKAVVVGVEGDSIQTVNPELGSEVEEDPSNDVSSVEDVEHAELIND